jgi:hypothetical protein
MGEGVSVEGRIVEVGDMACVGGWLVDWLVPAKGMAVAAQADINKITKHATIT